jgi:hypothetical protein
MILYNSDEEEAQLRSLFDLSEEALQLVLDGSCYTFEQAAFSSLGPEPLYATLLEAGFDEPHGKVIGRLVRVHLLAHDFVEAQMYIHISLTYTHAHTYMLVGIVGGRGSGVCC